VNNPRFVELTGEITFLDHAYNFQCIGVWSNDRGMDLKERRYYNRVMLRVQKRTGRCVSFNGTYLFGFVVFDRTRRIADVPETVQGVFEIAAIDNAQIVTDRIIPAVAQVDQRLFLKTGYTDESRSRLE